MKSAERLSVSNEPPRPRADGSLAAEADLLAVMVAAAPQCLAILAADGTVKKINRAGLRLFGKEELTGQNLPGLLSPVQRAELQRHLQQALPPEGVCLEFEIFNEAGVRRRVEAQVGALADGTRMLTASDVTGRRQTEMLLTGQNQLLEAIAAGAAMETVLTGLVRLIEGQSPEMICSILLLDEDGQRLRHGAAPGLSEAYNAAVDGKVIGPAVGSCGTAAYRREPVLVADIATDPLWEEFRDAALSLGLRACWSTPIFDAQRQVLGTFAIYYRQPGLPTAEHRRLIDLATHVAAICIGRHRSEAALRQSEELFHALAMAAPVGIFRTDGQGNCLFVNGRWSELTGLSFAEAAGTGWSRTLHPEDRERVYGLWCQSVQTNEPFKAEYRFLRPDGTTVWVYGQGVAERSPDGMVTEYIGTITDITERKRVEEQLRQAQKLDAIGQLAGGVAHDFNNILTIIEGNASLLCDKELAPRSVAEHAQQIIHAADRAAGLTRQLLLFGRKQVLRSANQDLNQVVTDLVPQIQQLLGGGIALQTALATSLPMIRADAGLVGQVVLNLVTNARDAMPNGGQLTIGTNREVITPGMARQHNVAPGQAVCLTISDTGLGIPPENMARLFEPFFTTKEVGKGTGLGLATAYGIVQQHRGWISVTSDLGERTSFKIYFPALDGATTGLEGSAAGGAMPRGTETILVVEDEKPLRLLVGSLLKRCGYDVLLAGSGPEALTVWAQHKGRIQLVLTDMVMPDGMSGRDLARHLLHERPELKIIYTSGYTPELTGPGVPLTENVNFLQKPYHPGQLAEIVRKGLDRK